MATTSSITTPSSAAVSRCGKLRAFRLFRTTTASLERERLSITRLATPCRPTLRGRLLILSAKCSTQSSRSADDGYCVTRTAKLEHVPHHRKKHEAGASSSLYSASG